MTKRSGPVPLGSTALLFGVFLFAVLGCGSADSAPPPVSQTLRITATEYRFDGDPATISAGETIRFELVNEGELDHELQLSNADGRILGQIDRLSPGASGSVEVNFAEAGVYTVFCDIDDHRSRGQQASFPVEE